MARLEKVGDRPVVELACKHGGNYKILDNGTRIDLTDEEWREELTKALRGCGGAKVPGAWGQPTEGTDNPLSSPEKGGAKRLAKVGNPQTEEGAFFIDGKTYTSLEDVAVDFATTTKVYKEAAIAAGCLPSFTKKVRKKLQRMGK